MHHNFHTTNRINVTLNYPPLGLVRASTRALHAEGMFVDTGAIALPHHAEVEVTVSYRQEGRLQVHRLQAQVGGRGVEGTRLDFRGGHTDLVPTFEKLLAPRAASMDVVA